MGLMLSNSSNKERLFGVVLFLVLLGGIGWWYACPKTVAEVGDSRISEADISYRIDVAQAYGTVIEQPAGLVALINDALERQVAARSGVFITDQELDGFSAGVDKHSKAPEVLKAVKQVFAGDDAAYRRIYLAPKMANRQLRNWFSRDAEMQKQPRAAIQRAYALAAAGNGFEAVVKTVGLKFVAQDYDTEKKQTPEALRGYFAEGMAMLTPGFQKLLDGLKLGEMAQTISEDDTSYRVVRLLEKKNGAYKTAEIIAVKESFDPWFKMQVKTIPVRIQNDVLRAAIAAKYPKLLWNHSGEGG